MELGLTYMDIKRKEALKSEPTRMKKIIMGIALFSMYAIVSTMDYQDCVRGAISC